MLKPKLLWSFFPVCEHLLKALVQWLGYMPVLLIQVTRMSK